MTISFHESDSGMTWSGMLGSPLPPSNEAWKPKRTVERTTPTEQRASNRQLGKSVYTRLAVSCAAMETALNSKGPSPQETDGSLPKRRDLAMSAKSTLGPRRIALGTRKAGVGKRIAWSEEEGLQTRF